MGVRLLNLEQGGSSSGSLTEWIALLQSLWTAQIVTPAGIRYHQLTHGEAREQMEGAAASLRAFPLETLTGTAERTAFWINVYNLLVVHGITVEGKGEHDRLDRRFYRRIGYRIGTEIWTPERIEHGVLRGNRRPPGRLRRRALSSKLAQRYALLELDPRLHAALMRGVRSGPPLRLYTPEGLDDQLEAATVEFLRRETQIVPHERLVITTPLVRWYRSDFGRSRADVIRFLLLRLGPQDQAFLREHLLHVRLAYRRYDWNVNALPEKGAIRGED
ncbi:MAG: hypothetical protein KatS3mg115_0485 [Candidatus Poribacteria bacterium]|nr:MAG: hypothetical protein KatS3mg115_0485 [Candidatus Poribacteria bacterium]